MLTDIFQQYYNLYPVMWRNGIIDMSSYHEVKQKSNLIKIAMFETDFDNPRYSHQIKVSLLPRKDDAHRIDLL